MKTYKQRTDDILNKTKQVKRKRRKMLLGTVIPCACAAFMAAFVGVSAAVLFTPYPTVEPTDYVALAEQQYAGNEYLHVIKQLESRRAIPSKKAYKNNYEKWSAQWNNLVDNFFGFGCGGADFSPNLDKNGNVNWGGGTTSGDIVEVPEDGVSSENGKYEETTDNQVAGVIEADLFKRTEEHIFHLSCGKLWVYSIEKQDSKLVSYYNLRNLSGGLSNSGSSTYREMFLSKDGNTVTVIQSVYNNGDKNTSGYYTVLINLDVSDPANIVEKGERQYFRGSYVSSRLIDGKILLVNDYSLQIQSVDYEEPSTYVPSYGAWGEMQCVAGEDVICPSDTASILYTSVYEIGQNSLSIEDGTAFLGYSNEIYVSQENIFLSREFVEGREIGDKNKYYNYVNVTEISCISYAGEGLEIKGSFQVDGHIKNQYSMDEYAGMLRVVTTTSSSYEDSNASLYCVRISDFETVGKVVGFAPKETVESVRFDGVKAYVCTAIVVTMKDPVFTFDLTDPTNITYVDTGVIEGYSSSLVNFKDGYLLGIGFSGNNSWSGDLKIEIYKETETKVESVCSFEMSVVFPSEYKAYYINREEGLVGMAVENYVETGLPYTSPYSYFLWEFDSESETISVLMNVNGVGISGINSTRATLIDGYFYMLDDYSGLTVRELPTKE